MARRKSLPERDRDRIMREIDERARLRTDHIDIYQATARPARAIEETAEAMRTLYDQGKIRAIGVSNSRWHRRALPPSCASARAGSHPTTSSSEPSRRTYSLTAAANNIATLGYGALCRGLLSGRMRATPPSKAMICGGSTRSSSRPLRAVPDSVGQLDQLARDFFHRRVIHLAVRWMLDQGISVALWGARHPDQMEAALGVAGWSLGAATRARIDRILSEAITDPVGPSFMAPLQRA